MRNSKHLLFACVVALCLELVACSTPTNARLNDFAFLQKGMTVSQAQDVFRDRRVVFDFTYNLPSVPYQVITTRVMVEKADRDSTVHYSATSGSGTRNSPIGIASDATYRVSESFFNNFRLVFKEGRLVFWGYDYEMRMSEDAELRLIVDAIQRHDLMEGR